MPESSDKRIRQYTVQINEDGMRLDEFLAYKIARFSRSRAQSCIRAGGVSIEPFRAPKPALKLKAQRVLRGLAPTLPQNQHQSESPGTFQIDSF